jgi:hypothetical protein
MKDKVMKFRIIKRANLYYAQYKGWFFWHYITHGNITYGRGLYNYIPTSFINEESALNACKELFEKCKPDEIIKEIEL